MFSNKNDWSGKPQKVRFLSEYNQTKVRKLFVVCLRNLLEILLYIYHI